MKAVVQRVVNASVSVDTRLCGKISGGLLVYLGVALDDTEKDADWIAEKVANLRIFGDDEGKMNLSILEVISQDQKNSACSTNDDSDKKIGVLAVSQFTLLGDASKGRRPSWGRAAPPEKARELYEYFMIKIREQGLLCESGEFQAHMQVTYTNDGPVTIILDSRQVH